MELPYEIFSIIIAVIVGLAVGGVAVYFINGRKPAVLPDTSARQEFEKERIRLQTELKHSGQMIADSKIRITEKDRRIESLAGELSESAKSLSVAGERVQSLTETVKRVNEKNELQSAELSNLRNDLAQTVATAGALEKNFAELKNQNNLKEIQIHDLKEIASNLRSDNATLQANLTANEGKLATQKSEIEDIRRKSHLEFENIANRLLESKTEKFTETNRANIENILLPLSKEIGLFKTKVEETYEKESQQRFSLEKEVKSLIEQTDKVSAEANNLAVALKGQAKTQGNWGEMILERILETNGLVRGREYDVQHPIKNSEGDQQYLDVIVHLPDNRKLIIDSKVTLVAYDRYCSAETEEERAHSLKEHIKALIAHIDRLSGKKYDEMENSPDFVMLFVPIEPAYLTALQNDTNLWARAYDKKILLISPTGLMGAVKMVSDLWKRDKQSKNALEIAAQGQKLYEKFIGFLGSLETVGDHINKSQDAYNKAVNQLKNGRGNLIGQSEKLKNLGIKTSKSLPASMLNFDTEFDESNLLEISEIG